MFRPTRSRLLLLISLQLLSSLALGQIICDPNNRPSAGSCNSLPISGVCGYTANNCPIELCGDYYRNSCAACADVNVVQYIPGECPPEVEVITCNIGYCPLREYEDFKPVCGYRLENSAYVSQTFENECLACEAPLFSRYMRGPCRDEREYCTPGKLQCTRNKDVCAFLTIDRFGLVSTTISSIAEACEDPSVSYFIRGECGDNYEERRYCLPNNRPEVCDEEYDPVCGFYMGNNGFMQHEIMPSSCAACADPDVISYTPGPCIFKCDLDPNVVYECSGVIIPVCGTYVEGGVEKRVSLRNDCLGCYYNPSKQILTWTDGLCPGDRGIRCENDNGRTGGGAVCGYKTEDCNNASCRTNYSNARLACQAAGVIWFAPGSC